MAKELDLQTKIIHSARRQDGYGRKMSNRFAIGIPDLLLGIHPFIPCFAEVKDLGEVVANFNRQLEVTPKQALEMQRLSEPYERLHNMYTPWKRAALVLVGIKHRGEHRLVALPRDAQRLDHTYEASPGAWTGREQGGHYDIRKLLASQHIAKLTLMPAG